MVKSNAHVQAGPLALKHSFATKLYVVINFDHDLAILAHRLAVDREFCSLLSYLFQTDEANSFVMFLLSR